MTRRCGVAMWLALAVCATADAGTPSSASPAQTPAALRRQADALFAPWNRPGSPGCALAVIRDGRVVYGRGYGMADVEHHAPVTPATVFPVASMSKQFTAFAIHLLAADGKLSLDDEVHRYLPELHDFGTPITIRQLLHHTSGLRDNWALFPLAGWHYQDLIEERDALDLIWRQRNLNFMPGEASIYSNTDYTLLGLIVQRVSGKSLADFTRERIFEPLGMRHTHFYARYGELVDGRAYSYEKQTDGGYQLEALSYSTEDGATTLMSTVEDLALWDQNFYDARVGGAGVIARMLEPGVLNSGVQIAYASGLSVRRYRGQKAVEHSGGFAGYSSNLIRFPEQHFSAVALCNADDAGAVQLTWQVADIFLGKVLKPAAPSASPPAPSPVRIDPKVLDEIVGEYEVRPGFTLVYTRENELLIAQAAGQSKLALTPIGERAFSYARADATVTFDRAGPDGKVSSATHHEGGRDFPLKRYVPVPPSAAELQVHEGDYYSDELGVLYRVVARDGALVVIYPHGEAALRRIDGETYTGPPPSLVRFSCTAGRPCDGFSVDNERALNVRFIRAQQAFAAVADDPAAAKAYAGSYELTAVQLLDVTQDRGHLYGQVNGQPRFELFPAGGSRYFSKVADLQVTFDPQIQGTVPGLKVRMDGVEATGRRVDAAVSAAVRGARQRTAPMPGSEEALRGILAALRGPPPYPGLTAQLREDEQQTAALRATLQRLGEVQSTGFLGVGELGEDLYNVRFAGGEEHWAITLGTDGSVALLVHTPHLAETQRLPQEHVDTLRSGLDSQAAAIELVNTTDATLQVWWIDPDGDVKPYGPLAAHHVRKLPTLASHVWLVGTDAQHPVAVFRATPGISVATVR